MLTDLEQEMLCMLIDARSQIQYMHEKFKETGTGNSAIARIDMLIARAEAKAKGPQCKCEIGSFNGTPLCGRKFVQSPVHYLGEFCGNTVAGGSKCGHDRACHIGGEG